MYDLILISPFNSQLGRFKRFVPRSVPIGVGILAGFLRSKGHSVRIVDNELVDLDRGMVTEILNGCNHPRIVGISVMTANVASGYRIARLFKSVDKDVVIVFVGIHATVMPDEVLQSGCVDFVVKGE